MDSPGQLPPLDPDSRGSRLPDRVLPSAFLRFWPAERYHDGFFAGLPEIPGIRRLGDHLLGVYPLRGRGQVFDVALRLAWGLQRRVDPATRETLPGLLIFPGNLSLNDRTAEVVPGPLTEDLGRQGPRLEPGKVFVTGYVASWLSGRYRLGPEKLYGAPSGRRVPLLEALGRMESVLPWHNRVVLGRRGRLARPRLEAELKHALTEPACRVVGSLGAGKTRVIWETVEGTKQWIGLGQVPFGTPELGPALASALSSWAGEAGAPPKEPRDLAEWLSAKAAVARQRLGSRPTIVVDDCQVAGDADRELLALLLEDRRLLESCGLVLSGRGVESAEVENLLRGLPTVGVPSLSRDEMDELFSPLLEGVELPDKVLERFLEAAAGHPFAFEEGLVRLVHENKIRSVYGSHFYAGKPEQRFEASERLVRHAEAEAERLGASVAVRMLALADQSIEPRHGARAAERFGLELPEDWHRPYVEAGWLEVEAPSTAGDSEPSASPRVRFAYPALGQALRQTVSDEGRGRLRHALGSILAESRRDETKWSAYRLMAGSPEALPPLLDFTRASTGVVSTRDEVFFALWSEHKEASERGVDPETELRILWALLPLARRLGKLGEVATELRRGVELARGDGQKWVPLVALQAELHTERGELRQAESCLREALSASEGLGSQRRATLFIRLGALLQREERLEEAQQVFLQLLSVVDKAGPTALGASCRYYLGNIALRQKKITEARQLHREAADFRRRNDLKKPLGVSLCALGSVALTEGDYTSALEEFERAEEVFREARAEPWDLSLAQLGQGRALASLGEITRATKPLRAALAAQEGREDALDEASARLELARNLLALEQDPSALEEARKAHFQLSLMEEISLLGDAEQLLGRILLKQKDFKTAREHLQQALRIHGKHEAAQAMAEDRAWLVEVAIREEDAEALALHAAELRELLRDLELPSGGEQLQFRLFRAFERLQEQGFETPDPLEYLRRSYKELMRKTHYLKPERRHAFLFQVRAHQEILNQAASRSISLPVMSVRPEDLE